MRERFTLVLKGHIAIARAVFPDGITGAQLDPFARQHLWAAGLDFDHGTGHGVGSYLSVHEGPARISKLGNTPLKRGMILSNEPGYYKTGEYGIRIENLVLVVEGPAVEGGEKPLNAFETLTLVPIDRRLIEMSMLSYDEISWIEIYHARVAAALMPLVDDATRDLARRRDPAARPGLRRQVRGRRHRPATARPSPNRSDALGAAAVADGVDRHRPDHAQHRGAGAAGDGEPACDRRRHHPAHRFGLSAGARGGTAADGAAVRPLRPAAGRCSPGLRSPRAPACSPS